MWGHNALSEELNLIKKTVVQLSLLTRSDNELWKALWKALV